MAKSIIPSFEEVLFTAMKVPGVRIKRDVYLQKELMKYYPQDIVDKAITYNPAQAGVTREAVKTIALSSIQAETIHVAAVSAGVSLCTGAAAAVADMADYFAAVIRVVQKLAYLYGFPELNLHGDCIDDETKNMIYLLLGSMFGVKEANIVLGKLADSIAKRISTQLARQALTHGTVYPIVKKIAAKLGIRMTKQIFADTVASGIPLAGGVLSGALSYAMFKPNCIRLMESLSKYRLSNPESYKSVDGNDNVIVEGAFA